MKALFLALGAILMSSSQAIRGDGIARPPIDCKGSLNERSQEPIIVFREGEDGKSAPEELLIKIQGEGDARNFAWIVPLPNPPKTTKADSKLFEELHDYVQERQRQAGGLQRQRLLPSPPRRSRPGTASGSSPTTPPDNFVLFDKRDGGPAVD